MFTRDAKPARIDTLIARSVRINGDVEFAGGLHLDGQVAGDVRGDTATPASLSVSESGSIEGSVTVADSGPAWGRPGRHRSSWACRPGGERPR